MGDAGGETSSKDRMEDADIGLARSLCSRMTAALTSVLRGSGNKTESGRGDVGSIFISGN